MPIILETQVLSWHPDFYILFRIIPSFLLKVLTRSFIMISGFDQGASNWKLGIKNYILGIFDQDQNIEHGFWFVFTESQIAMLRSALVLTFYHW